MAEGQQLSYSAPKGCGPWAPGHMSPPPDPPPAADLPPSQPEWTSWPEDKLLDVRLCDLGLSIKGTDLETHIRTLYGELKERGLCFRPFFYVSDEWFTPDEVTGVAVPFYMVHPRLAKLELSQMLEVEGGTEEWCMRILRHETGHAIDHAYHLNRRRRRQELFGRSSQPYPEHYTPRPYSRSFVLHLKPWYAQSHPDEDFAETFAVWLTPGAQWRQRYADWPALKKLEYVDEVMAEIGPQPPRSVSRRRVDALPSLHKTLRQHYEEKRARYGIESANVYDRDLRRLFSDRPELAHNPKAAWFLARIRKEVRRLVARWTGQYQYTIDQVLDDVIQRCRELNLRLVESEERTKLDFAVFLAVQTMNYLHSGQHRVWL
jgi:hypothetical protein